MNAPAPSLPSRRSGVETLVNLALFSLLTQRVHGMDTPALRLLIRQKLSDGRLPRNGIPVVWGGAGNGQQCDACTEPVAKTDFAMEGPVLDGGRRARDVQFHVLCFHIWDDERGGTDPVRSTQPDAVPEPTSAATAYLDYLILTLATEQPSGGWAVAVTIYDPDGALAMESPHLGGGVTFHTKAIADNAGVLFARAWIGGKI